MKINFNGKDYNSIDDMPPNVRAAYEALTKTFTDSDGNGMPDIFEGKGNAQVVNLGNVFTNQTGFTSIVHEGKTYSNLDELPSDVRAKYDAAMSKLSAKFGDQNQNGVPDILETRHLNVSQNSTSLPTSFASPIASPPASANNDTRLFLVGIAIVILLIIVAGLLALILLAPRFFARWP